MSSKKLKFFFFFLFVSLNLQIEAADEFIYSLKLGESFDSIRGKLDFGYSTKNAHNFSFVSLQLIPGAPRYTTNTTIIFFQERLAGAIFTTNPRITDFSSYEERNQFMLNTYKVLVEKFDDKYGLDRGNEFVDCGLRASHDFADCTALSHFSNKYKFIRIRYFEEKIHLYIVHRKAFNSIDDFTNKALLSFYSEHLNGLLKYEQVNTPPGLVKEEKSINYETSTLEVQYSEIP